MSSKKLPPRRSSTEERRIFRTARLEYVEIGRIMGMDAAAAALYRHTDIAPKRLIDFQLWSQQGLEALMLCRPPVLIGPTGGTGQLGWLANAEVLLAAQQHWKPDTRIPAIVLAHQVTTRTREIAAGGGLFASSAPVLTSPVSPSALYRTWLEMTRAGINHLATSGKMNFAHATGCDSRRLPAAGQKSKTGAEDDQA